MARTTTSSGSAVKKMPKGNRWRIARRISRKTTGKREGPSSIRESVARSSPRNSVPRPGPFALIPGGGVERVELCLRPNDQTRHLPTGAQALFDAVDDVLPGTSFAWSVVMRREPLLQECLLPLL